MQCLKEESDEESGGDEENASQSGSEDSGFGIAKKGKKGKQVKKPMLKRQPKKAAVPPNAVPALPPALASEAGGPNSSSKSSSKTAIKAPEKLISSAGLLKEAIKNATFLSLWQLPQKSKEMDTKIKKALDKCGQLELLVDNEAAGKLKTELFEAATNMGTWVDLVQQFKFNMDPKDATSVCNQVVAHAETLAKMIGQLPMDCCKTVLIDLGRNLAEAN